MSARPGADVPYPKATEARKPDTPGRARYKPSNHCAGNVGLPPLNLYARVRISSCTLHTRPRVQRASGIPCALSFREGQNLLANLGQIVPRERRCLSIPSKLNRPSRPHKGRDQEGVRPTPTFPELMRPCAVIQRLPPPSISPYFQGEVFTQDR